MNIAYIIPLLEIITVIIATVFRKKYFSSTEKYFFYFLWFTAFIDISGAAWGFLVSSNNYWIFNIFIFLSCLFYFYWYYSILKKRLYKKIIVVFSMIFILYAIYNFINLSWDGYHVPTFIYGSIMITIISLFYFSELLNNDQILEVKYELRFWISIGLLLFNVGMVPYMIFSREYINADLSNIILIFLNVVLYGSYSLGFIWCKKEDEVSW